MNPTVDQFVNGIMTPPGKGSSWNVKAVTWGNCQFAQQPRKFEALQYLVGPLSRGFVSGQKRRAAKLAKRLGYYMDAGFDIRLTGHSNGANVIQNALELLNWPRIECVSLISPASDEDMESEGWNAALINGAIGQLRVFSAGQDRALGWFAAKPWGRMLGYGGMGWHGPKNISKKITVEERQGTTAQLEVVREHYFGHSTWFTPEHLEKTFHAITCITR